MQAHTLIHSSYCMGGCPSEGLLHLVMCSWQLSHVLPVTCSFMHPPAHALARLTGSTAHLWRMLARCQIQSVRKGRFEGSHQLAKNAQSPACVLGLTLAVSQGPQACCLCIPKAQCACSWGFMSAISWHCSPELNVYCNSSLHHGEHMRRHTAASHTVLHVVIFSGGEQAAGRVFTRHAAAVQAQSSHPQEHSAY